MPAPSFSDLPDFRPFPNDSNGGRPARNDGTPPTPPSLFKFNRSSSYQGLAAMNDANHPSWMFRSQAPSPRKHRPRPITAVPDVTNLQQRCSIDANVIARLDDLLGALQPNSQGDASRAEALAQIEVVIKKSLGAKVFPHGSFALKTYLPESDLNLCAFFTHNNHKAWGQRALKLLARSSDDTDARHPIRGAELIPGPDAGKMIRVNVGEYRVEISANTSHVLSSCALFEEVDRLVDCDHLFKRSIVLVKAWAAYDARVLGASRSLLSSYVIRSMVLFVFNAFHDRIQIPLDALLLLLQYLAQFDWTRHVFGLFGPIHLSALPHYESVVGEPCSWPSNATPLISKALLSRYAVDPASSAPADGAFSDWTFNVIDPRNPAQNLGAGLSPMTAAFVKDQLTETARRALTSAAAWDPDTDARVLFGLLMPGVLARASTITVPDDVVPVFDADLGQMTKRILQAAEFDMPDISERDLVQLMVGILQDNDSVVTVGKMGSLMHSATNNHALPAMLKARYGGLKKLLRRHDGVFALAADHPHNPHVMLLPTYAPALALWSTPDCSPSRSPSPSPISPGTTATTPGLFAPVPQHTIWPATSPAVPPRPASVPVHSGRSWRDDGTSASLWAAPTPPSTPHWYPSLPEEFFCPISGDIIRDPVIASDGVTYDRSSLEVLRQSCRTFSPLTGLPLDLTNVYPNLALKSLLTKIRSDELVLTSRPTGTLSRIGHYYERCASIWG